MQEKTFPIHLLEKNFTVIDFYCAGFLGKNTWQLIRDKISDYTGIDSDREKLMEMISQSDVERDSFFVSDSFNYARYCHEQFDMVIMDPWTKDFKVCYLNLGLYSTLAKKYLLVSTNAEHSQFLPPNVQGMHLVFLWKRSDYLNGTYWAVYER